MQVADKVAGIFKNLLGQSREESLIEEATRIRAPRFDPWKQGSHPAEQSEARFTKWIKIWEKLQLGDLPGFPLWEESLFDSLNAALDLLVDLFHFYCRTGALPEPTGAVSRVGRGPAPASSKEKEREVVPSTLSLPDWLAFLKDARLLTKTTAQAEACPVSR
eukprot:GHVR01182955.1.p2 GENE.GHVR01182955.1~~GHVR01182955.1.p2  ORF type:complete len:162 (-),score=38.34 GHVR01182955.1:28-513(-)